jgi:hypothetical protein
MSDSRSTTEATQVPQETSNDVEAPTTAQEAPEATQRELAYGDHEHLVTIARGLVTNELMIADLSRHEWQTSLAMMLPSLAEYTNLGLILVPFAAHASMPWINNIAPGMVMQCQGVAREDIEALTAECERMYAALHPEQEKTVSDQPDERKPDEYLDDEPGIDPRLIDPDEEDEPDE